MEKQSRKQSSKHGNSANKNNTKTNKNFNLLKIREAKKSLEEKTKEVIVPIMKIQKKLSLKFDIFTKDYNDIIKKAETLNKEIITHLEENKNDTMNITDIQLNQKYAINHENMIKFYEKVTNKLESFTNLINSNEYDNLVKEFNNIISENELLYDKEEEKKILENLEKKCLVLKKNVKKLKKPKLLGTNTKRILKRVGVKVKEKKSNRKEMATKSRKPDKDLLEILQNEYKDNSYIQKISKTFFKRRLFKNVIYKHNFDYKEDGSIEENKYRSSGESTIYKYGKFTFNFKNDEFNQENFDNLVKFVGEDLKQCFTKIDDENKEYIIGGKMGCLIAEFLNKTIRKNLYSEFKIIKACIEFYEFYEELINEFNNNESSVKIIKCDEQIYNNLKKDWESLQLVRDFVNKNKKNATIEGLINNTSNDNNDKQNDNQNEINNGNNNDNINESINDNISDNVKKNNNNDINEKNNDNNIEINN